MSASPSRASCRLRVFFDAGCSPTSILDAGLVASSALLLSNSLRSWVVYTAVLGVPVGGACSWSAVEIDGSRVRWLRPGELNVAGMMRSLLSGRRWPGARLLDPNEARRLHEACTPVEEALEARKCPGCISVSHSAAGFKPWWLLAAAMVVCDEGCLGRGGQEGGVDS